MVALREKDLQEFHKVNWEEINPDLKDKLHDKRKKEESIVDVIQRELENILNENKNKEDALIEVLHEVQQLIGFIPKSVQKKVAVGLGVSPGKVSSVISFYAHFSERPKGKYEIALCKGTACYVKGSGEIIEKIKNEYDIKSGETTDDGMFSLEVVRCLGACGLAPVMTVNGKAHGLLNPEKAIDILDKYKNEEV